MSNYRAALFNNGLSFRDAYNSERKRNDRLWQVDMRKFKIKTGTRAPSINGPGL